MPHTFPTKSLKMQEMNGEKDQCRPVLEQDVTELGEMSMTNASKCQRGLLQSIAKSVEQKIFF